ncbi:hypothetical protein AB3M83_02005 [Microbacterium sp. 179-B 1A2 NHS]|uniref:hypothetical protein n=1 Tax=Microbacterium sp. 179-B 1A2 NHS TaxID=3142383 RepID=UPI0039A3402D
MTDRDYDTDEMPDTEDLEEPSVAKDPGEEPTAPAGAEESGDDASHRAVGIGVIDSDGGPDDASGDDSGGDPGEDPDEDPYEN